MRKCNARADGPAMALLVCNSSVREKSFFTFKASTIKQSYHPNCLIKSSMKHTSAGSMEE
jgi:hypothetical protein